MTTILKTRELTTSDLTEFIAAALPPTIGSYKMIIHARIKMWLLANSVEEKQPKKKAKKPGKRQQLRMKL